MIIKSKRIDGFGTFSDYLTGEGPNRLENEECNFVASSNGLDVNRWCIESSRIATTKRKGKNPLKKPIEHIIWRTREGDILTPEMVKPRVTRLLKKLGYQDCPWVLVQHMKKQKNGKIEPHYHLGILRIDSKGKVPNPKSKEVCRIAADKFALEVGFKVASAERTSEKYGKRTSKIAGLFVDAINMRPKERLAHFIKNGFLPARGDRGQLVFIDKEGKPHSPNRIPQAKAMGLKQNDMPAYFGLSASDMKGLPPVRQISSAIKRAGWKAPRDLIMKGIDHGKRKVRPTEPRNETFGRDSKPLPSVRPWHGLRLQRADQLLPTRPDGTGFLRNEELQPVQPQNRGGRQHMGVDPSVYGRAQAAADAVIAKYSVMIEAIYKNRGPSKEQRDAAVRAIKILQQQEVKAVRQKIIEEEKQNAKARKLGQSALNVSSTLT